MADEENGGGGAQAPEPVRTPDGGEPRFTQAEVDRILGERIARYADYDDLKEQAKEAGTWKEQKEQLEQQLGSATEKLAKTDIRFAVLAEANRAGAVDPEDVIALLPEDAVKIDDAGRVQGVAKAVAALQSRKPHLFAQKPSGGGGDGGAREFAPSQSNGHSDMDTLIRRAVTGG